MSKRTSLSFIHPMLREAMSRERRCKPTSFRIVDDYVIEESDMLVHEFTVDNMESNHMFIAHSNLATWLETDAGQWILDHCVEAPYIMWYKNAIYGDCTYRILARLVAQNQTYFALKYK